MGKIVSFFTFIFMFFGLPMYAASELPVYEKYVDEIIDSFAKEMKKEKKLLCIGSGGRMPYNVETIRIMFVAYQKSSIEDARKLQIEVTEKLVQKVNEHEKIRPFLKEYPFTSDRACISISFYTKKNNYYTDKDSVSRVFHSRDRLVYRTATENGERTLPFYEEPYADALKLVQSKP
jgi:hypothetical protein